MDQPNFQIILKLESQKTHLIRNIMEEVTKQYKTQIESRKSELNQLSQLSQLSSSSQPIKTAEQESHESTVSTKRKKRPKERYIGEVHKKVRRWRELYQGAIDASGKRI